MLLISGLSWNLLPAAHRIVKSPSLYLYNVPDTNPSIFQIPTETNINQPLFFIPTPNYRPDRCLPLPLSSRVILPCLYKYKNKYKCVLYNCALFYCTLSHLSAFRSYVYSYNLYPVPHLSTCAFIYCISGPFSAYPAPHLDWKKFSKTYPAMQIKCTVFIRTIHSAAFFYCISGYPASAYCISGCFLSFDSYVDLYNSYPAPTTNWTNQSTLYKFALCFLSAFHGYVYLYNSYPATQINWTVFRRIFIYCTYIR